MALQTSLQTGLGYGNNLMSPAQQLNPIKIGFIRYFLLSTALIGGLQSAIAGIDLDGNITKEALPSAVMVNPNITIRLANPQFDCNTDKYTLDVEFQSNLSNQELFGMNVRFWYDDSVLELINFTGFLGGYGPVAPNPPAKSTSSGAGPAWFNFVGAAEFVNGAMQLTNENLPPIIISTTGWTKVFQLSFTVDDPNANLNNFCPSVIWDLEVNPANGGYLPGSDGIVMTVVNPSGGSLPVDEAVNHFNWAYSGNGTPPYGAPVQNTCSSINCAPLISCPVNITLDCGSSTLPSNTGSASATDLCNGDPTLSYSDAISGGPCPAPNVISRTWVATDNCGNSSNCIQTIAIGASNCNLTVNTTSSSGPGSLRDAISCAMENDTIDFHTSLAGQTITITGTSILLNKTLYIRSNVTPRIKIESSAPGLFEVATGKTVEFKDLDLSSGTAVAGNNGAAFNNNGTLKFINVKVFKNPSLPTGQYLVRNKPASTFNLSGSCFIEIP